MCLASMGNYVFGKDNLSKLVGFDIIFRSPSCMPWIKNLAAATAIAGLVPDDELSDENILPAAFDERVADVISAAVKAHI